MRNFTVSLDHAEASTVKRITVYAQTEAAERVLWQDERAGDETDWGQVTKATVWL